MPTLILFVPLIREGGCWKCPTESTGCPAGMIRCPQWSVAPCPFWILDETLHCKFCQNASTFCQNVSTFCQWQKTRSTRTFFSSMTGKQQKIQNNLIVSQRCIFFKHDRKGAYKQLLCDIIKSYIDNTGLDNNDCPVNWFPCETDFGRSGMAKLQAVTPWANVSICTFHIWVPWTIHYACHWQVINWGGGGKYLKNNNKIRLALQYIDDNNVTLHCGIFLWQISRIFKYLLLNIIIFQVLSQTLNFCRIDAELMQFHLYEAGGVNALNFAEIY